MPSARRPWRAASEGVSHRFQAEGPKNPCQNASSRSRTRPGNPLRPFIWEMSAYRHLVEPGFGVWKRREVRMRRYLAIGIIALVLIGFAPPAARADPNPDFLT